MAQKYVCTYVSVRKERETEGAERERDNRKVVKYNKCNIWRIWVKGTRNFFVSFLPFLCRSKMTSK